MHCRILSPETFDKIKELINKTVHDGQEGMSSIKQLTSSVEKVQALIAYTEMTQGYEFTDEQLTKPSTIRILESKFQELVKEDAESVNKILSKIGEMRPDGRPIQDTEGYKGVMSHVPHRIKQAVINKSYKFLNQDAISEVNDLNAAIIVEMLDRIQKKIARYAIDRKDVESNIYRIGSIINGGFKDYRKADGSIDTGAVLNELVRKGDNEKVSPDAIGRIKDTFLEVATELVHDAMKAKMSIIDVLQSVAGNGEIRMLSIAERNAIGVVDSTIYGLIATGAKNMIDKGARTLRDASVLGYRQNPDASAQAIKSRQERRKGRLLEDIVKGVVSSLLKNDSGFLYDYKSKEAKEKLYEATKKAVKNRIGRANSMAKEVIISRAIRNVGLESKTDFAIALRQGIKFEYRSNNSLNRTKLEEQIADVISKQNDPEITNAKDEIIEAIATAYGVVMSEKDILQGLSTDITEDERMFHLATRKAVKAVLGSTVALQKMEEAEEHEDADEKEDDDSPYVADLFDGMYEDEEGDQAEDSEETGSSEEGDAGEDVRFIDAEEKSVMSTVTPAVRALFAVIEDIGLDGKPVTDTFGYTKFKPLGETFNTLASVMVGIENSEDMLDRLEMLEIVEPWVKQLRPFIDYRKHSGAKRKRMKAMATQLFSAINKIRISYAVQDKNGYVFSPDRSSSLDVINNWSNKFKETFGQNGLALSAQDIQEIKDKAENSIEELVTLEKKKLWKKKDESIDITRERDRKIAQLQSDISRVLQKIGIFVEPRMLSIEWTKAAETLRGFNGSANDIAPVWSDKGQPSNILATLEYSIRNYADQLKGLASQFAEGKRFILESPITFVTEKGYSKIASDLSLIAAAFYTGKLSYDTTGTRVEGLLFASNLAPSYRDTVFQDLQVRGNNPQQKIRDTIQKEYIDKDEIYRTQVPLEGLKDKYPTANAFLNDAYQEINPTLKKFSRRRIVVNNGQKMNKWGGDELAELYYNAQRDHKSEFYWAHLPVAAEASTLEFVKVRRLDPMKKDKDGNLVDMDYAVDHLTMLAYNEARRADHLAYEGGMKIGKRNDSADKFVFMPGLNDFKVEINGVEFNIMDILANRGVTEEEKREFISEYNRLRGVNVNDEYQLLRHEVMEQLNKDARDEAEFWDTVDMKKKPSATERYQLAFNGIFWRIQIGNLLYGDKAILGGVVNEVKRAKQAQSNIQRLDLEKNAVRRTVVINDRMADRLTKEIKAILDKKKELGLITQAGYDASLKAYSKITATDGQAWLSPTGYKRVLEGMGQGYTDGAIEALEEMANAIKEGREPDYSKIKDHRFNVIKSLYYGSTHVTEGDGENKRDNKVIQQYKHSEALLTGLNEEGVSSPFLNALVKFMEDNQIDAIEYDSASKVGNYATVDLRMDDIAPIKYKFKINGRERTVTADSIEAFNKKMVGYVKKKELSEEEVEKHRAKFSKMLSDEISENIAVKLAESATEVEVDGKTKLVADRVQDGRIKFDEKKVKDMPYKYYGIQTSTPLHSFNTWQRLGTQLRKIITTNLKNLDTFEIAGTQVSGYQIKEAINQIVGQHAIDEFIKSGIEMNPDSERINKKSVNSYNKRFDRLRKRLLEALRESDYYDPSTESYLDVHVDEYGRKHFTDDIYDPSFQDALHSAFYAMAAKKIYRMMVPGGSLIQISSAEASNDLKVVYKKDGSIDYVPVRVTPHSSEILEYANEKGEIDIKKIEADGREDLLELVAYRIPTESKYSAFPLRIVGFLPRVAGGVIQVPHECIAQAGFDFDVDKLFFMKKDAGPGKEKIAEIKKEYEEKVRQAKLEEKKEPKKPAVLDLEYSTSEVFKNGGVNTRQLNQRQRTNVLFDIIRGVLRSPQAALEMAQPGGYDGVKKDLKIGYIIGEMSKEKLEEILEQVLDEEDDKKIGDKVIFEYLHNLDLDKINKIVDIYRSGKNIAKSEVELEMQKQNKAGLGLVGVFANENTATSVFQQAKLIELSKTVKINGEEYKSLNRMEGVDGTYVSRILEEYSAASVDNAKDPVIGLANITMDNASIIATMVRMGVPGDIIGLITATPLWKVIANIEGDGGRSEILFKALRQGGEVNSNRDVDVTLKNIVECSKFETQEAITDALKATDENVEKAFKQLDDRTQVAVKKVAGLLIEVVNAASEIKDLVFQSKSDVSSSGPKGGVNESVFAMVKSIDQIERAQNHRYIRHEGIIVPLRTLPGLSPGATTKTFIEQNKDGHFYKMYLGLGLFGTMYAESVYNPKVSPMFALTIVETARKLGVKPTMDFTKKFISAYDQYMSSAITTYSEDEKGKNVLTQEIITKFPDIFNRTAPESLRKIIELGRDNIAPFLLKGEYVEKKFNTLVFKSLGSPNEERALSRATAIFEEIIEQAHNTRLTGVERAKALRDYELLKGLALYATYMSGNPNMKVMLQAIPQSVKALMMGRSRMLMRIKNQALELRAGGDVDTEFTHQFTQNYVRENIRKIGKVMPPSMTQPLLKATNGVAPDHISIASNKREPVYILLDQNEPNRGVIYVQGRDTRTGKAETVYTRVDSRGIVTVDGGKIYDDYRLDGGYLLESLQKLQPDKFDLSYMSGNGMLLMAEAVDAKSHEGAVSYLHDFGAARAAAEIQKKNAEEEGNNPCE